MNLERCNQWIELTATFSHGKFATIRDIFGRVEEKKISQNIGGGDSGSSAFIYILGLS